MNKRFYLLKVQLLGMKPDIWRRFVVPADITLDHLHIVIRIVMGWNNSHLYEFIIEKKRYSENPESKKDGQICSRYRLGDLINQKGLTFRYIYDFGDGWEHTIRLEEIQPFDLDIIYPQCIGGKRACPPDDCGGPPGYATMLAALKDSNHPEHELYLDWVGEEFDPEWFDMDEANDALFLGLFLEDDTEPPMAPINRHLVVMTPTQAYFELRDRLQDARSEAFDQEESFPLAFLVPITPSLSDLEDELGSLMPMFITMQMLMETFDPEIVAQIAEEELADLFTFQIIPLVFDLDWQSPLIHFTPDLFDEEFEEEEL